MPVRCAGVCAKAGYREARQGMLPRDRPGRRAAGEAATNHIDWGQVPERSDTARIFDMIRASGNWIAAEFAIGCGFGAKTIP